ncbi:MAG: methyltransferase domain-containing protein [Candidatus Nanopelagicaceae bacterium]|nr:methyltransferase domain-containing protein [Candidatus Nanopelagicaceae bacterium]
MLFKTATREKNTPFMLRLLWKTYYLLQKILPAGFLLKMLLNTVWALWRLSWEQTNVYEKRHETEGKVDILRPRNVSDAVAGVSASQRVCDFGGGAGDISTAFLKLGCNVVYADTNPALEANMLKRFGHLPNFKVANSYEVADGREGEFDLIVMSHVLEHIEDPRSFLEKLGKTTQRIHIEVPDLAAEPLSYIRVKLGLPVYKDDDHIIEMSLEYLKKLIEDSNYTVETIVSRDAALVARAKSNAI